MSSDFGTCGFVYCIFRIYEQLYQLFSIIHVFYVPRLKLVFPLSFPTYHCPLRLLLTFSTLVYKYRQNLNQPRVCKCDPDWSPTAVARQREGGVHLTEWAQCDSAHDPLSAAGSIHSRDVTMHDPAVSRPPPQLTPTVFNFTVFLSVESCPPVMWWVKCLCAWVRRSSAVGRSSTVRFLFGRLFIFVVFKSVRVWISAIVFFVLEALCAHARMNYLVKGFC